MKNELPKKNNKIECGIINLEDSSEEGSHWVAYYKNNDKKYCFDSYGKVYPPKEVVKYLGPKNLLYNEEIIQNYNDPPMCGHFCLIVLGKLLKVENYNEILENLENLKETSLYIKIEDYVWEKLKSTLEKEINNALKKLNVKVGETTSSKIINTLLCLIALENNDDLKKTIIK
jgi:hypothetical protein